MIPLLTLLAAGASPVFPTPLDQYPDLAGAGLFDVLAARARLVPFNLAASGIFVLAVLHTFVAKRFRALAHDIQERRDEAARAKGQEPLPSVSAELLHFFGEVEVIFGLWAVALFVTIVSFYGWETAVHYVNETNYTEALFVVVIMALAASQPVLRLAEAALRARSEVDPAQSFASCSPSIRMILDSQKKKAILSALSDPEAVSIINSTMNQSKSVSDIIRETNMPHTTAYRKIKWLVDEKLLVVDKVLINDEGKKYSLFHSVYRSMVVKYENNEIQIEAERNIEPVNRLTERFFSLGQDD
jgi:DNA-binding transcriptional ArsR family regulator